MYNVPPRNNLPPQNKQSILPWIFIAISILLVVGVGVFALLYYGLGVIHSNNGIIGIGPGNNGNGGSGSTQPGTNPSPYPSVAPLLGITGNMLHTQGNRLVDSAGNTVVLRGAQIESSFNVIRLTASEQLATNNLTTSTFTLMHDTWHMNVLRFPICEELWQSNPTSYTANLENVVAQANRVGLYVVLNDHSDNRCGHPKTPLKLPSSLAIPFWQAVAAAFKNDPLVIFDAFNEPNVPNNDWPLWLNGGTQDGTTYVGMQQIVNTIRQQGAKQPIVVESLTTGDGLSTIGNDLVKDSNIIYSYHVYFIDKKERTTADWDRLFGSISNSHPVLIGEWAFLPNANYPSFCKDLTSTTATQLVQSFLSYMQQNNINWVAWNFEPTHLIVDYNSFTPTTLTVPWSCGQKTTDAGMGTLIKQYLTTNGA